MFVLFRSLAALTVLLLVVATPSLASAEAARPQPRLDVTPSDLVNAVNALRVAYGLVPYSVNSILMLTAQNQADFMAANGLVTHSGPGGTTMTQRLLAAGYPLGGDLSQGGFRSENIIALNGGSAEQAVEAWMGDAPHQNTMLSPNLTEIGAGVTVVNGTAYLVIDCARPTTGGAPQAPAATPVAGGGATVPANEAVMVPVTMSTPNANGQVVHEVQSGQTLWQIAISYGVKIDQLKSLNGLTGNDIYPGERLLVMVNVASSVETPTPASTAGPSATPFVLPTSSPLPTPTATPVSLPPVARPGSSVMPVALGIIAFALLGGGLLAWLAPSSAKKRN
jgi:uncharacterized protein YkwD